MLLEKANMLNNLVGEPFKYASVNQQTWDRMRDRVNKESSFMLSSNVQRAFDLLRIYECNAKFLNKEEKQLHNRLLDKYEQFDSGRHPMAAPIHRL